MESGQTALTVRWYVNRFATDLGEHEHSKSAEVANFFRAADSELLRITGTTKTVLLSLRALPTSTMSLRSMTLGAIVRIPRNRRIASADTENRKVLKADEHAQLFDCGLCRRSNCQRP